jgi:hypothetical protein
MLNVPLYSARSFSTFWDVYCGLRYLVEVAVPEVVAESLRESIMNDGSCVSEPLTFAHLKGPVLEGNEVNESEVGFAGTDWPGGAYVQGQALPFHISHVISSPD